MAEEEVGTALDLLNADFGGTFPSISGGDAAPSSAGANSGSNSLGMSSSFSVSGSGSTQSTGATAGANNTDYIILAVALAALFFALSNKKK